MTSIYSQEYATKMYGKEQYAEGRQEGIKQGKKEGMIESFLIMVKKGMVEIADVAKELGMSKKEFMKLVK